MNAFTLIVTKKLRTILDIKCSLFLSLTYVLTEYNQGLFFKGSISPSKQH